MGELGVVNQSGRWVKFESIEAASESLDLFTWSRKVKICNCGGDGDSWTPPKAAG